MEDRIVEIDRKTGEVVYELNVSDLIDPSDGGSLNQTDSDWCHNNSIDYDPDTDTILLSCRHLDAVLGIEKNTSTLKWVLGDPKGFSSVPAEKFFTPVHTENGFEWQYAPTVPRKDTKIWLSLGILSTPEPCAITLIRNP